MVSKDYDIKKDLPDLVFTSQPYESVTPEQFWAENIAPYTRLVYLPYYTCDELLHIFGICKSFYADTSDCTYGTGVWYITSVVYRGICIWRWVFKCILSDKPRAAYQFRIGKCWIQQMAEMELEIPACQSFADL